MLCPTLTRYHVIAVIAALLCIIALGFGHLLMFGQGGFLDHKDTVENITLFAKEVLPRLRELHPEPQRAAAAE